MSLKTYEANIRTALNFLNADELNRFTAACLDKMTDDDVYQLVEAWCDADNIRTEQMIETLENLAS